MKSLFDTAPPHTVKKLCDLVKPETIVHEGNDDPKWAEKMVKALYKKLKKSKALDELERSISNEDRLSDCVVVPVTLDGKIASSKKSQPHVLYTRMWRYPWIRSHNELKAVDNCRYPFAKKMAQVCVNPFHYEAVHTPAPALPPIVVPRSRNFGTPVDFSTAMSRLMALPGDDMVPNTSFMGDEMRAGYLSEESSPGGSLMNSPMGISPPSGGFEGHSPSFFPVHPSPPSMPNSSGSEGTLGAVSPQSYLSEDQDMDIDMDVDGEEGAVSLPRTPQSNLSAELVEYYEPECWMSICYHEQDKRVGDAYLATQPYLLVDGFTAPSDSERFCLGYLNNVNRPTTVIDSRKHIGRGVRFYYIGGEVYCECLSDSAIFVQSPNCNQRHGWHPSTVCKVPPMCNLKIFNNAEFAQLLSASVEKGFEAVYALTRMCTIRISFVKGWGAEYKRQTVMSTPCWIEAHLNGPLQWIDRVLTSMGAPPNVCSSFT